MKQQKDEEYNFKEESIFTRDDRSLSIFGLTNQEQYQKGKFEQTTYTFSGQITRSVTIPTLPTSIVLNLSNTTRVFFIARVPLTVTKVIISYTEADGTNTMQVEKLTNGQVVGSGVNIPKTAYNIALAKNVSYIKEQDDITMSPFDRSLEKGDRLAVKFASTPTTIENLTVLVEYTY